MVPNNLRGTPRFHSKSSNIFSVQCWPHNGGGSLWKSQFSPKPLYYLTDCPLCILQPRKTTINTLPCSLSNSLYRTLRNLEFVYLKLDFVYLIFSWCFIFSKFFLIIKTAKHSTLKHWNQFYGKRHDSC